MLHNISGLVARLTRAIAKAGLRLHAWTLREHQALVEVRSVAQAKVVNGLHLAMASLEQTLEYEQGRLDTALDEDAAAWAALDAELDHVRNAITGRQPPAPNAVPVRPDQV